MNAELIHQFFKITTATDRKGWGRWSRRKRMENLISMKMTHLSSSFCQQPLDTAIMLKLIKSLETLLEFASYRLITRKYEKEKTFLHFLFSFFHRILRPWLPTFLLEPLRLSKVVVWSSCCLGQLILLSSYTPWLWTFTLATGQSPITTLWVDSTKGMSSLNSPMILK